MQLVTIKVDDYVTHEFTWDDFEYQRAPDWTAFAFCFLTVNQEKNTSMSPGRATKNIFSVAQGQMLVASVDRALLEYSLVHMYQY